jgi:hypothetical protein
MRLTSEATLEDIYSTTDEWRLPVEPLSRRIPVVRFLLEGGYGYGSLTEGSLSSKILNITWSRNGKSYHYGLDKSTLYNAGYPLQRILPSGKSRILGTEMGEIECLTLLANQASTPVVHFEERDVEAIDVPADATDLVFLNEKAASLLGLSRSGLLVASPQGVASGGAAPEVWEKRHIEDALPGGLETTRVLAVKSSLPELLTTAGPESYGLVLATLKGFVVNLYCPEKTAVAVREKVGSLEHCYLL